MSLVFMGESRSWVANDLHANILLPLIVARSGSFKEQRRSKRGYSYQYSSSFMVTRFGSLTSLEDYEERIFIPTFSFYGRKI